MTLYTLEHGLILEAPNLNAEITYLLYQLQHQADDCQSPAHTMQFNALIWNQLDEEFE